MMELSELGWNAFFENAFGQWDGDGLVPARVIREDREAYTLLSKTGELMGRVSGRFSHEAVGAGSYPSVGDWVVVRPQPGERKATIHAVLPRRSCFSRQSAGGTSDEQVVAANIDTVFIVSALDGGRAFNARRIERYLTLAWESGASPVLVLNKVDVCPDVAGFVAEAEAVAIGVPVHPVSALQGTGIDELRAYLPEGQTGALLGSSGVGKSALMNALLGYERQVTGEVRADDMRGRHTTVHRELVVLPTGGMVIDTPGMRELRLVGDESSVSGTFGDVEELAASCRYRDCTHQEESGCAIQQAIADGELDAARYDSYLRLQREMAHASARQSHEGRQGIKTRGKQLSQHIRNYYKVTGR